MPTITKETIRGKFCSELGDWIDENFEGEGEETAVVALAVEEGHLDAVEEFVLHLLTEQDVLERSVKALAATPTEEESPWKWVVDEASKGFGSADVGGIRDRMRAWPDEDRLARVVVRLLREAIDGKDEGDRPALWVAVVNAARA